MLLRGRRIVGPIKGEPRRAIRLVEIRPLTTSTIVVGVVVVGIHAPVVLLAVGSVSAAH